MVPGAEIEIGEGQWDDDPFQQGSLRGPFDISIIQNELNFSPQYDLYKGLVEFIDWLKRVDKELAGSS